MLRNESWLRQISKVIENISDDSVIESLVDMVGSIIGYDAALTVLFDQVLKLEVLHSNSVTRSDDCGINEYQALRLIEAFDIGALSRIEPALYRYSDLRIPPYTNNGIVDGALILVPVEQGQFLIMAFLRLTKYGRFTESEWELFESIHPVIISAISQYYQIRLSNSESGLNNALAEFGRDVLTERERQIARLIIKGVCSKEIATELDITYGTVKNHRKNLYGKLGVSSNSQLFNCFIQALE